MRNVKNIKNSLQAISEVGAEIALDIKDVGGRLLIAQIKDDGGDVVVGCSTYSNIMSAKIEGCQSVLKGVSCVVDQPPSVY